MMNHIALRCFLFFLVFSHSWVTYAQSKTLKFRMLADPATLDWNLAHSLIEPPILFNLMEGLITLDEKLNVVPTLAERFEVSADQKTYTFHLRKGVLWSDGQPLKADDFVQSWKRLLSPATAAPYQYFLYDIEGAQEFGQGKITDFSQVGIQAPRDDLFVVKLKRPVANWISVPSLWVTFPIRKDRIDRFGSAWARPGNMLTVGPFVLDSYDIDSRIVMKKNTRYWGKTGNITEAIGLIVKDDTTAYQLFKNGTLDLIQNIPPLQMAEIKKSPEYTAYPYLQVTYLAFKNNRYPTTNVHLRRALALAISKTELVSALQGFQKPATSFVSPEVLGFSQTLGLPFDPKKAKEELKKSGLLIDSKFKIELLGLNSDRSLLITQFFQNQIKKNLGLEVSIEIFDNRAYRSQIDLDQSNLFLSSWTADYPDPDNFLSLFSSTAGNNRSRFKSKSYDELLASARAERNLKSREKKYLEMQKLLLETEAAVIPLFYDKNDTLIKKRVKNLKMNSLNQIFLKSVSLD